MSEQPSTVRVYRTRFSPWYAWAASDAFSSLTRSRAGRAAGDGSMKAIVQAAASGLLVQLGHTVTATSAVIYSCPPTRWLHRTAVTVETADPDTLFGVAWLPTRRVLEGV
jgi:hypothetical protein